MYWLSEQAFLGARQTGAKSKVNPLKGFSLLCFVLAGCNRFCQLSPISIRHRFAALVCRAPSLLCKRQWKCQGHGNHVGRNHVGRFTRAGCTGRLRTCTRCACSVLVSTHVNTHKWLWGRASAPVTRACWSKCTGCTTENMWLCPPTRFLPTWFPFSWSMLVGFYCWETEHLSASLVEQHLGHSNVNGFSHQKAPTITVKHTCNNIIINSCMCVYLSILSLSLSVYIYIYTYIHTYIHYYCI